MINKVQTAFKALQLLSEPEMLNKLYAEVKKSSSQGPNPSLRNEYTEVNDGTFIYHKHFIVQVIN